MVGRDIAELDAIGKNFPSQALVIQCDLTIDMQLLDMKTAVAEKFGSLDILINCAGKSEFKRNKNYLRCDLRGLYRDNLPTGFRLSDGHQLQDSIRAGTVLPRLPSTIERMHH